VAATWLQTGVATCDDRSRLIDEYETWSRSFEKVDDNAAVTEIDAAMQMLNDVQSSLLYWTGEFRHHTELKLEGVEQHLHVSGQGEFWYDGEHSRHRSRFSRIGKTDPLAGRIVYGLCTDGVAYEWDDEPGSSMLRLKGDPRVPQWNRDVSRVVERCSRNEFLGRTLFGEFFDIHRMRNRTRNKFAANVKRVISRVGLTEVSLSSSSDNGVQKYLLDDPRLDGSRFVSYFTSATGYNLERFLWFGSDGGLYVALEISYREEGELRGIPRQLLETRWGESGEIELQLQIEVVSDTTNVAVPAHIFTFSECGLRTGDRIRNTGEGKVAAIVFENELLSVSEYEEKFKLSDE